MNLWWRLFWESITWRFRTKKEISDLGVRTFRVWPTDLDIFAHMNNGVFVQLLDLGRYDLSLRSHAWQHWKKQGWYAVVVAENITFRKSLMPWMTFQLETKLIGWDNEAFFFEQRFTARGEIYAKAIVRIRFLKRAGGSVKTAEVFASKPWVGPEPVLPQWVSDWAKASLLPRLHEDGTSVWE
jgi:acyl-CoA thioesterase FadM